MKTFSPEVRELAYEISSGYCQCSRNCIERVTEFHHLLSNTIVNQKKFPLFIQSIFNCCPISNNCHMTKPLLKITEKQAEGFERWLQTFKKTEQ